MIKSESVNFDDGHISKLIALYGEETFRLMNLLERSHHKRRDCAVIFADNLEAAQYFRMVPNDVLSYLNLSSVAENINAHVNVNNKMSPEKGNGVLIVSIECVSMYSPRPFDLFKFQAFGKNDIFLSKRVLALRELFKELESRACIDE